MLHMGNTESWSQEKIWQSWRFEMVTKTLSVFRLNCLIRSSIREYLKDGDFYDAGDFQSAKSAYNFLHELMKL